MVRALLSLKGGQKRTRRGCKARTTRHPGYSAPTQPPSGSGLCPLLAQLQNPSAVRVRTTGEGATTQLSTGAGSQPLLCPEIAVTKPWPPPLHLALEALLRPPLDPRTPPRAPGLGPVNSVSEFLPQAFGLAELATPSACTLPHTHTHTRTAHTTPHTPHDAHANTTHKHHKIYIPPTHPTRPTRTSSTHEPHAHTLPMHTTCTYTHTYSLLPNWSLSTPHHTPPSNPLHSCLSDFSKTQIRLLSCLNSSPSSGFAESSG